MSQEEPEKIKLQILELSRKYAEMKFSPKPFVAGRDRIDPSGKLFDGEEIRMGIEAVLDGWWTEGRFTKEFEKRLAGYIGCEKTLLVNSGSSANLVAFYSLTSQKLRERRIEKGNEVITIATAFPTTVAPIVQAGAVPVFVDIEAIENGTYNIDTSKLEEALSERTKAIFIAHTLGNPFDIDAVEKFRKENSLWLIEDGCDALGSTWDGKKVGTFGDLSTLSFYPAHHITMGEGGAVVINNPKLKKLVESFRNWGRDCWCEPGKDNTCGMRYGWSLGTLPKGYDHKNIYTHLGFNLKLTDMQAAIGLAQMGKLELFVEKRKENFSYLRERLRNYESELVLPQALPKADPSWFGLILSVREGASFTREEMTQYLESRGVGSRALFAGNLTRHPAMQEINYRVVGGLKNSDEAMNRSFWIGVQPNITEEKREYMIRTIDEFMTSKG